MGICKSFKLLFIIALILIIIFVISGNCLFTYMQQREAAYSHNSDAANLVELLMSSVDSSLNLKTKKDEDKAKSILNILSKEGLPFGVSKMWVTSVDPVEGIKEVYTEYDINIRLKPSDYIFNSNKSFVELYAKDLSERGYYVTLKKISGSNMILALAKKELPLFEIFSLAIKNSILTLLFFLCVSVFLALIGKKKILNCFDHFNTIMIKVINSEDYDVSDEKEYLISHQVELLDKVQMMKDNILRDSENIKIEKEKFEVILRDILDAVIVIDPEGSVIFINRFAEKLINFSAENIRGKEFDSILKFQNIDDGGSIVSPVDVVLNSYKGFRFNSNLKLIRREYAKDLIVSLSASLAECRNGKGYVVVVLRDITNESTKTEGLRNSNDILKNNLENITQMLKAACIATWRFNIETGKLYVGKDYCDLLHIARKEIIDFKNEIIPRIYDPAEIIGCINRIKSYKLGPFVIKFSVRGDDGVFRRILCSGRVTQKFLDDELNDVNGIIIDISADEVAQDELEAQNKQSKVSNERLQQVYNMTNVFFWEYDIEKDLITGDSNFMKTFKRFDDNSQYISLDMICQNIKSESINSLHKTVRNAITQKKNDCMLEFSTRPDKDGRIRHMKSYINFKYDDAGKILNSYGAVLDVTEEYEKQLRLLHISKIEAISALTKGLSVDFNKIFTGIIADLELIENKVRGKDDILFDFCSAIRKNCERADDFISKLSDFSKKNVDRYEDFNLNNIVENAVGILKHIVTNAINIEYNSFLSEATVKGCITDLQNILVNLFLNSCDAINEKEKKIRSFSGLVSIRVLKYNHDLFNSSLICGKIVPEMEYAVVEIEDNGIGISTDKLDKILEPFYTTKNEGEGIGLGLSLLNEIIEKHKGAVSIESNEGVGTVFSLILPLVVNRNTKFDGSEIGENPEEISSASVGNGDNQYNKGMILIVDDEPVMRFIYNQLLSEQGYIVIEASNGQEGVDKYIENQKDIIGVIMDFRMPEMDGKEAFENILEIDSEAKVVFISGYLGKASQQELLDMGAVDVLSKPFRKKSFVHSVEDLFIKK